MKLIDLYKEWMEKGKLSGAGLCWNIPHEYKLTFEMFEPTSIEKRKMDKDGFCEVYWASGLPVYHDDETKGFTPLRQTIVLLICAMHDEL